MEQSCRILPPEREPPMEPDPRVGAERCVSRSPLPVLNTQTHLLLRALSDQQASLVNMARVVEKFPSIAARLIYLANSAWSAPKSPVTSIEGACSRLGLGIVQSVSIALTASSPFSPHVCPAFDVERFWTSSLLCAECVGMLLPQLDRGIDVDPGSARTAGLLHNLGLLMMADRLPGLTQDALAAARADPTLSLTQAQRDRLGFDYCSAGYCLAREWTLPSPLPECMAYHREPYYTREWRDSVWLVGCAEGLVARLFQPDIHGQAQAFADRLGIAPADLELTAERIKERRNVTAELARTLFG